MTDRAMKPLAFGEIVAGLKPEKVRRTFQPVRRNSYTRGEREARVWRPIAHNNRETRRVIAARLKAAEHYDRVRKAEGKKNGPLGHVGLEVLRELYRIVDFKTGRLEPAIDTICARIRRSRVAVVDAMARLKLHGFLDWIRRSEPTENEGQAGPQVRQITNAYFFGLPKAAAAWVRGILGHDAPIPDCEATRAAIDKAETEAMLDAGTTDDVVDFHVGNENPQLAEILKRLGASLSKNSASSDNGQNPVSERI